MSEKNVVTLHGVSVYHTVDPFAEPTERRLLEEGELVLGDVNLEVGRGEFIYLIGRVGSGKSSLLKTLYAELPLVCGDGEVVGFNLRRLTRHDIPYLRRQIGIVFQDMQLLPDRNVAQNLRFVLQSTGWRDEQKIAARIVEVLTQVGLEHKHYKMPFELSGGEQQRLVIARALLNDPPLVLADEPTGNLDPVTADSIMQLFQRIAERGTSIIMSTHNAALVEHYPARALIFAHSRVKDVDLHEKLSQQTEI